jgi:hypothetical protein
MAALLWTLGSGGCSVLNRHGPDVTCEDLANGQINACADGIIAYCTDGEEVTYEVCTEEVDGTDASDLCEAPWQSDGAFRCAPEGSGGSGGTGPGKIVVGTVNVEDDSNDDGMLSPGETATIALYGKNVGAITVEDVSASLTEWDPSITLTSCVAQGSSGSTQSCTAACDCSGVSASAQQDFDGGETGIYPILRIDVRVAQDAPLAPATFDVRFAAASGETFDESFELPVLDPDANIHVGSWTLADDSNEDGALTPGETATLEIYAENQGAAQALNVFTSLTGRDPNVILSNCTAQGSSGSTQSCTSMCSCDGVSESATQDLDPADTGIYPILRIDFRLSESAPLQPVLFELVFEDDWGNTWTDEISIDVVSTGADIVLGTVSLVDDSNDDGKLTPGESGTFEIYAKNNGTSRVLDLTASLTDWPNDVIITNCVSQGSSGSTQSCSTSCDCSGVSASAAQDLDPSDTGIYPILEVDFMLSTTAPKTSVSFEVTFEDAWGNTWVETFQRPVVATGANLEVGSASLVDDSGNDGQLSPGETGTVRVYAKNVGTSQVLDAAATVTSGGVSMTSCVAQGSSGSTQTCVPTCNCTNVSAAARQDLDPGETGIYEIVEIDFSLSSGAPIQPVTFNVVFTDAWDNTWTDSFQIPVVP